MDFYEADLILRSGDPRLMKDLIEKHAGGDPQRADSLVRMIRNDVSKGRTAALVLMGIGAVSVIFLIGIPLMVGGVIKLSRTSIALRTLDGGYALWKSGRA